MAQVLSGPARVLVWTETHQLGGCDRYLADLLPRLDPERWAVALAGNPNPEFDAWLADRGLGPRHTIPVASLPDSRLERWRARLGVRGAAETGAAAGTTGGALTVEEGSLARRAGVAGLRYQHLAVNVARGRRMLRRARPDLLFINNGGYPGAESCRALTVAAEAEGVPRVVHFVHNMAYPPFWPAAVERRYDARLDATTTWVTAAHRASEALKTTRGFREVATVHYGIPPAALPAPAPSELTGFTDGALNLAVVAAFEPRKGHLSLIEALAQVPNARAALVGAGSATAAIEARIAELGLGERVRLLGWRDDVPAILAAADALALPSLGNECCPTRSSRRWPRGCPCSPPTSRASPRWSTTAARATSSRPATRPRWPPGWPRWRTLRNVRGRSARRAANACRASSRWRRWSTPRPPFGGSAQPRVRRSPPEPATLGRRSRWDDRAAAARPDDSPHTNSRHRGPVV